jgi:O-antigen/teichoic acid export membrane protein
VKVHSIRYNAAMNMILTTSSIIFPLITVPYVSRVLSTYGLGAVTFASSVLSYFLLVAQFGISLYGVRACAPVRDDKEKLSHVVKELLVLLTLTTAVVTFAYIAAFFLVPRFQEEPVLHIMFGLALWLGSFGVEWFYQALEQYDYITIRSVIFKAVGLVLMFVLVKGTDDYISYGWIVILTGYGSNIVNLLRLRRFCDLTDRKPLHPLHHLKAMVWFAVASSASNMYTQTDIILLGFLATNSVVGVYQIVSKIESLLKQAVNSVGNVLLPRMSYYISHGRQDELNGLMAKTVNFIAVASIYLIAVCTVCPDEIVGILGGQSFAEAALPLVANGPAVLFSATNIPLASYLVARSGEKKWAKANALSLIFSYAVGIPLVIAFGMVGAGLAISFTEGFGMFLRIHYCKELFQAIRPKLDVAKPFAAGAIAGIITWIFASLFLTSSSQIISLVVKGIFFTLVYFLLLLMMKETFVKDSVGRYTSHRA